MTDHIIAEHINTPHAPINAQKNSDITIAEVTAKLRAGITSTLADLASVNANTYTLDSGWYIAASNAPFSPDCALFVMQYNTSYISQLAINWRTGEMAHRGRNNGVWTSWLNSLTIEETGIGGTTFPAVPSNNCNSVNVSGFTTGIAISNAPNTGRYIIESLFIGSSYKVQIAYNVNPGGLYIRFWNSSTGWTGWTDLETTGQVSAVANSIVQRSASADISARLFRSEYTSSTASPNYINVQHALGTGDNYIRGISASEFRRLVIAPYFESLSSGTTYDPVEVYDGSNSNGSWVSVQRIKSGVSGAFNNLYRDLVICRHTVLTSGPSSFQWRFPLDFSAVPQVFTNANEFGTMSTADLITTTGARIISFDNAANNANPAYVCVMAIGSSQLIGLV